MLCLTPFFALINFDIVSSDTAIPDLSARLKLAWPGIFSNDLLSVCDLIKVGLSR